MTNREMLIKALQDDFDDYAYSESVIAYHVECPYFSGDKRAHCKDVYGWYGLIKKPTREMCSECKMEWLEAEVDE